MPTYPPENDDVPFTENKAEEVEKVNRLEEIRECVLLNMAISPGAPEPEKYVSHERFPEPSFTRVVLEVPCASGKRYGTFLIESVPDGYTVKIGEEEATVNNPSAVVVPIARAAVRVDVAAPVNPAPRVM